MSGKLVAAKDVEARTMASKVIPYVVQCFFFVVVLALYYGLGLVISHTEQI